MFCCVIWRRAWWRSCLMTWSSLGKQHARIAQACPPALPHPWCPPCISCMSCPPILLPHIAHPLIPTIAKENRFLRFRKWCSTGPEKKHKNWCESRREESNVYLQRTIWRSPCMSLQSSFWEPHTAQIHPLPITNNSIYFSRRNISESTVEATLCIFWTNKDWIYTHIRAHVCIRWRQKWKIWTWRVKSDLLPGHPATGPSGLSGIFEELSIFRRPRLSKVKSVGHTPEQRLLALLLLLALFLLPLLRLSQNPELIIANPHTSCNMWKIAHSSVWRWQWKSSQSHVSFPLFLSGTLNSYVSLLLLCFGLLYVARYEFVYVLCRFEWENHWTREQGISIPWFLTNYVALRHTLKKPKNWS